MPAKSSQAINTHTLKLQNTHANPPTHTHTCIKTTSSTADRGPGPLGNVSLLFPPLLLAFCSQNGTLFLLLVAVLFALVGGRFVIGEAREVGVCCDRFPQGKEPTALT